MPKEVNITVGDQEYKISKEKAGELKQWLSENADIVAQTSDDLIIDIEDTAGVEIEFNELVEDRKDSEEQQDEARREQTE